MKNRKTAGLVILALLCSILLLSVSCRKNSDTSSSASSESTPVVTESKTETKTASVKSDDSDEVFAPSPVISEPVVETVTVEDSAADTVEVVIEEEKSEEKTEETAAVIAAEEPVSPETVVVEAEDRPFYEGYFSYNGYSSYVVIDNTMASLTIPEGVSFEDIKAVAGMIEKSYPQESSLIIYDITDNTVILTYPEQSDEYLSSVIGYVASAAEAILDKYPLNVEEESAAAVEEPVLQAEDNPVYSQKLRFMGVETDVTVYKDYATATLPIGMTEDDIATLASMIASAYEAEASYVTYSLSGDVLTLFYPEQTDDFLLSAVKVLGTEAMKLISRFRKQSVKSEEKTPSAVVEAAPSDETPSDTAMVTEPVEAETVAEVPVTEEKTEAVSAVQTKTDEPAAVTAKAEKMRRFSVSAVAAPVYSKSVGTFGVDKFGFIAGLRFEAAFTKSIALGLEGAYDFNHNIEGGAYLRWTPVNAGKADFYVLLGGGGVFGIADQSGSISFAARGALGCSYSVSDLFSVFGEGTVRWSQNNGFEYGGSVGVRFTF